jgi:hypothetical protein
MAQKHHFWRYLLVNRHANRGNYCVFAAFQKRDEPPVARRLDFTPLGMGF